MNSDAASLPRGNAARTLVFALVVLAVIVLAVVAGRRGGEEPPSAPAGTRFANMDPSVGYVGSDACLSCHEDIARDHGLSAHGRSFGPVDPDQAGVPATFSHKPTGRSFTVTAGEGGLAVREFLPGKDGGETIQERVLTSVIGSGRHRQDFVLWAEDVPMHAALVRIPGKDGLTWQIAPDQDHPDRTSFDETMTGRCLFCHTGRIERVEPRRGGFRILEDAISCESCHGPGALHVARWKDGAKATGEPDDTIASFAHMSRQQSLDVCGRCHTSDFLSAGRMDRPLEDWRPGMLLSEFRVRYADKDVVHPFLRNAPADQLARSSCFQKSETLTCVTCHGGHGAPRTDEERIAHYRAACLSCHGEQDGAKDACGLPRAQRLEVEPGDDCTQCHMPRQAQYELHRSFVDHHIAVHDATEEPSTRFPDRKPEIEPLESIDHLSEVEQQRLQGLASIVLSWVPGRTTPSQMSLQDDAVDLLTSLEGEAAEDPVVLGAQAMLYMNRRQPKRALEKAEAALASERHLPIRVRATVLRILIDLLMADRQWEQAETYLAQLHKLRRDESDWILSSVVARERGDKEAGRVAAETMLEIAPQRAGVQFQASEIFRWLGETQRADYHGGLGQRIEQAKTRR